MSKDSFTVLTISAIDLEHVCGGGVNFSDPDEVVACMDGAFSAGAESQKRGLVMDYQNQVSPYSNGVGSVGRSLSGAAACDLAALKVRAQKQGR